MLELGSIELETRFVSNFPGAHGKNYFLVTRAAYCLLVVSLFDTEYVFIFDALCTFCICGNAKN
jgi:hypothetical protein